MALNEMYEGLEIIHLEDFSNEVNIDVDLPLRTVASTSQGILLGEADQRQKAVFGNIAQICYGASGTTDVPNREFTSQPRVSSRNNVLKLSANKLSANGFIASGPGVTSFPFIGLLFTYPETYSNKRVILSMDYTPVEGESPSNSVFLSKICVRRDHLPTPTHVELVPFENRNLPGKLEFVFESGTLRVFFRGRLVGNLAHPYRTVFLGEFITCLNTSRVMSGHAIIADNKNPFNLSNLVMVAVPLNSPLKRLGNLRVQRVQVNLLDGVPHLSTDALNGPRTDDGLSVNVDHNVNTVKFEPITLNSGEEIIGTQTCISGTNTPTGSHLETKVLNGSEEIGDVTHVLIETHLAREVIGDFKLGPLPEDYVDVSLKVRSVEV